MAIQMRRGLRKDFDPNKMLPGEWAVSIDSSTSNQIVWMCFAAGVCKRMGTYEDFTAQIAEATEDIREEYVTEFESIKAEIQAIADGVEADKDEVVVIKSDITDTYLPQMLQYVSDAQSASQDSAEYAQDSSDSADVSKDYSVTSKSYAVGGTGTRVGEDTDNAEYYYQQAKSTAESLGSPINPQGTVAFEDLPPLSEVETNWMYNISNEFTTTSDFVEGAGNVMPIGTNVYKTSAGKWDCFAGSPVTGVKGANENTYRKGNVNITKANIGLGNVDNTSDANKPVSTPQQAALDLKLDKTGDSQNNTVAFTSGDASNPTNWTDVAVLATGKKHSELFNKISTMFKNIRYLYKMLGTTDISSIGNGTTTGAISALYSGLDAANATLGTTDISGIGNGTVTGAIDTINSNLSWKKLGDTTGNTPISLSPIFDEAKEIQICVKVNNTYDFITTVSTTFLNEFSISHTLEVGGYYGSVSANARASVYFNPSTKDISIVNAYQNGNDLLKNSTLYIYYR